VEDTNGSESISTAVGGVKTTRSGRVSRQPKKYDDYVVYEACLEQKEIMESMLEYESPVGMIASSDPDTSHVLP
jgi:hypothetical protein